MTLPANTVHPLRMLLLTALAAIVRPRADLVAENLALRQQLAVVKAKRPRPTIRDRDRLFRIALRHLWSPREMLDHVIVLTDAHLRYMLSSHVSYCHEDRCHLALGKDPATTRAVTPLPSVSANVVALPGIGGLHHRYERRDAA